MEEYSKSRGFWEPYEQFVPGSVVYNSKELVKAIQTNQYDYGQIMKFSNEWNEFSTGTSSLRLIQAIYSKNKSAETISRG